MKLPTSGNLIIAGLILSIIFLATFHRWIATPRFGGFSLEVVVSDVNCSALFLGDKNEMYKAAVFQSRNPKTPTSADEFVFVKHTTDCPSFVAGRRYATRPMNAEEADFPLAFSILMYKDVEQFERLLRAIYRPQNIYCVHVDRKSSTDIQKAVRGIASCFDNVFVTPTQYDVRWGTYTVLAPEFTCMTELLRRDKKWKFFINLTGQEFPLKTNWQIVRILKAFNGSNNMEGTIKGRNMDRYANSPPLPVNVTLTKGSVHIVATRAFVDYVINNQTAAKFLDWVKTTKIPDETFFSSLNHSPQLGVPGSYLGITQ